jgi:hypothetical protein
LSRCSQVVIVLAGRKNRTLLYPSGESYCNIQQKTLRTPWWIAFLEKSFLSHLIKKSSTFSMLWMFITVLKTARHWSLPWASFFLISWGETESTRYVGQYFAYCTSSGW